MKTTPKVDNNRHHRMMYLERFLICSAAMAMLACVSACGSLSKKDKGTVVGAGLGTAAGAAVTGSKLGAVGGGVAGGIIGHEIGEKD